MSHPRSRVPVRRPPRVAGSRLAGRTRPKQRIDVDTSAPVDTVVGAPEDTSADTLADGPTDGPVDQPAGAAAGIDAAPEVADEPDRAAARHPSPHSRIEDASPGGASVADRVGRDRPRRRHRRGPGWWWVAALTAAVVALAVVTTLLMFGWRRAEARTRARAEVPSLAKTYAAKILSYDYRHIRADARAAAAVTTGDYRRQYRTSMDQLIIPQAGQVHAVVRAEVINAGVTSVTDDGHQAVVLVYANQTVTNTQISGSRVDQVRVRLTLVHTGRGWRVAKVDSL